MQLNLTIVADSALVLEDLFEKPLPQVSDGEQKQIGTSAAHIILVDFTHGRSFGLNEAFSFVLNFGAGIGGNLIASWLWERLQRRTVSLKIDGRICRLDVKDLEAVVERALRRQERQDTEESAAKREPAE